MLKNLKIRTSSFSVREEELASPSLGEAASRRFLSSSSLLIRNAKIITPTGEQVGDCLIRDGKIVELDDRISAENSAMLDAAEHYLYDGFIDLQCNGGFGHDFTTAPETIWPVAFVFAGEALLGYVFY